LVQVLSMGKHKLHYQRFGPFYRPLVPITIQHGKIKLNYLALLDSGADFNIFHSDLAEILGINLSKLQTTSFGGIQAGNEGKGYYSALTLGIEGFTFNAPIVFSKEISPDGYGILGQQGFFDHFKVTFEHKKKLIWLTG